MYSNKKIMEIAKIQLSKDYNCDIQDLFRDGNTITDAKLTKGRRILDSDGCSFKMLCIEGKVIVSVKKELKEWCNKKIKNKDGSWIFEYPKLRAIDEKLMEFGEEIEDIHEYFLPKGNCRETKPLFKVRWYEEKELNELKEDGRFDEAFGYDENCPDILAVAAYDEDDDEIMGVAGASRDSETIWQIGINVIDKYRNKGVATNLTALLKDEILRRGKVPYYGTAQSHLNSKKVAINAGFSPAWVELTSAKK